MICINSVSVSPKSITLKVGSWCYDATASVSPANASCDEVYWRSENPSVASVNASSGHICANGIGTTRIYASAVDGSGCKDYLTVTVSNTIPVTSVTLDRSTISLEEGNSILLIATVSPNNASNKKVNWTSSNNNVATVFDGIVTAVSKGSATITATAADGSGKSASCSVTVTGDILVTEIEVNPSGQHIFAGDSYLLEATVSPGNATNPGVCWSSSDPSIVTVNSSGLVTTQGCGEAIVYATACDGSGVRDSCYIFVTEKIQIEKINLSSENLTIGINEFRSLSACVIPNTSNEPILWRSQNEDIVKIQENPQDDSEVYLRPQKAGTTNIMAKSKSGNAYAYCTVTVDDRERVVVTKDSHSFYVKFNDGKIWRFIGIDLSKRSQNYTGLYKPDFNRDNYSSLILEEQRYLDNIETCFSVKQIAYLYLFDPLGIEYYMRTNAYDAQNNICEGILEFKDNVYEAIFGTTERSMGRFFFVLADGKPNYLRSFSDRSNVYSNAQILFGFHTIIDWDWSSFIKTFLEGLFGAFVEDSVLGYVIDAYQILFHSGGILGGCFESAQSFAVDYINDSIKGTQNAYLIKKYGNDIAEKASKTFNWASTLLLILADSLSEGLSIITPNNMTLYNKVNNNSEFFPIFKGFGKELTMEDIINQANKN